MWRLTVSGQSVTCIPRKDPGSCGYKSWACLMFACAFLSPAILYILPHALHPVEYGESSQLSDPM